MVQLTTRGKRDRVSVKKERACQMVISVLKKNTAEVRGRGLLAGGTRGCRWNLSGPRRPHWKDVSEPRLELEMSPFVGTATASQVAKKRVSDRLFSFCVCSPSPPDLGCVLVLAAWTVTLLDGPVPCEWQRSWLPWDLAATSPSWVRTPVCRLIV